jgi:sec-independent protein translocase protein TatA
MLSSVFLFFSFSGSEVMLILFVALILFGGDKFPEIARGLGKGIREFKDMSDGVKREIHTQINNYDLDPNRTSTTPAPTEPQQPVEPVYNHGPEETHDITVTSHESAVAPHPEHTETAAPAAPHEPAAETPALPKPDLTQPPNTISHQSY